MPCFKRPLAALLIAGALPFATPAAAQEAAPENSRPDFWDYFSLENLGEAFVHSALSWARLLADIRYDQISVDPIAMRVTMTGMRISPYLPGMPADQCVAHVSRATINSAAIDRIANRRFRVALDGVQVGAGCFPFDAAATLRGLGFRTLNAGRIEADMVYDYASGGMDVRVVADLDRLANVQLEADIDYVSYRMDFDREEPVFAVDLNAAELTVEDRGAWALAQNFLPPAMATPEAITGVVADGLRQGMTQANGPGRALSETQQGFADQAGAAAARFAGAPGRIVLSTAIAKAPIRLNEGSVADFRALFDALAPQVGERTTGLQAALPVAVLGEVINSEEPPENAFEIGKALLTGIGAPLNRAEGVRLLLPASRAGNREANLLIAGALAEINPSDAYSHALLAAATGQPGGLALLDRIERRMSFDEVIEEQNRMTNSPDDTLYTDLAAMRRAARDYLSGVGRPRSWRAAYYWATMAAAAGDGSAAALRDEITETMRLRGDAGPWADQADSLESGVLRDWIAKDVPGQLR